MPDTRKIVKVFLASPGDLKDERLAAKAVVDEFNKQWGANLGCHIELVGWEDTVSQFGRPQEVINRDLDQCELFIGMLWKRWGTPPDNTGRYTSGFHEEYEISIAKRKLGKKPDISLLFKDVDPGLKNDPGEELKKVLKFRERIESERTILYETFGDLRVFESKLRGIITTYMQRLREEEADLASEKNRSPRADVPSGQGVSADANSEISAATDEEIAEIPAAELILSTEGSQFVMSLLEKTITDEDEPLTNVEVARFRLLGTVLSAGGNDNEYLGVHDANLLFLHREQLSFSDKEKLALLRTGLVHISSENIPVWHWANSVSRNYLPIYSIVGHSDSQKIGALRAMRLVREPLPQVLNRNPFLESWFSSQAAPDLQAAALAYLAECGVADDLTKIMDVYNRAEYQTKGPAIDAIIRIKLRNGRKGAIEAVYELQPETIDDELVKGLFGDGATLDTALLLKGINHRSPKIRRKIVSLLSKRGKLDAAIGSSLLTDTDASVRFHALMACIKSGRAFTDQEAKGILVKPVMGGFGLGFLSPYPGSSDKEGEENWKRYRHQSYAKMTERELEALAAEGGIFDSLAHVALHDHKFKSRADALRTMIDDRYARVFQDEVTSYSKRLGTDSNSIQKMKSLEEPIRKELTSEALEIICKKGFPEDLERVRRTIKSEFVTYSDAAVEYLRKFGEWQDIELLIRAVEHPKYSGSLLSLGDSDRYRTAARAIFAIGRERLSELLSSKMSSSLLSHLVVQASDKAFRDLTDELVLNLLISESDRVRKAVALKCIRTLPKTRIKQIVETYSQDGKKYYYNVVHWLDLAISLPKSQATTTAQRVIEHEWLS